MIDLHMHTNCSDGTDTVEELLKKAEEKKLEVISITDHNNCNAYLELEKIKVDDFYKGKIITGIELNTKAAGIPIEILGYNVDYKKMNELASKTYVDAVRRNEIEFERLVKKCKENGFILDDDIEEKFDRNDFASTTIHKSLTNHEENRSKINERSWNSIRDFYRDYMSNPSTELFIETSDLLPSFDEAVDIVKQAGGLVFIPHIYEYRDNTPKVLDYILENGRLDGIECYYTTFTEEQHKYLLGLAKERNLYISGGSDYHGSRKPDTDLGVGHGNLEIPYDIQESWGRFVKIGKL